MKNNKHLLMQSYISNLFKNVFCSKKRNRNDSSGYKHPVLPTKSKIYLDQDLKQNTEKTYQKRKKKQKNFTQKKIKTEKNSLCKSLSNNKTFNNEHNYNNKHNGRNDINSISRMSQTNAKTSKNSSNEAYKELSSKCLTDFKSISKNSNSSSLQSPSLGIINLLDDSSSNSDIEEVDHINSVYYSNDPIDIYSHNEIMVNQNKTACQANYKNNQNIKKININNASHYSRNYINKFDSPNESSNRDPISNNKIKHTICNDILLNSYPDNFIFNNCNKKLDFSNNENNINEFKEMNYDYSHKYTKSTSEKLEKKLYHISCNLDKFKIFAEDKIQQREMKYTENQIKYNQNNQMLPFPGANNKNYSNEKKSLINQIHDGLERYCHLKADAKNFPLIPYEDIVFLTRNIENESKEVLEIVEKFFFESDCDNNFISNNQPSPKASEQYGELLKNFEDFILSRYSELKLRHQYLYNKLYFCDQLFIKNLENIDYIKRFPSENILKLNLEDFDRIIIPIFSPMYLQAEPKEEDFKASYRNLFSEYKTTSSSKQLDTKINKRLSNSGLFNDNCDSSLKMENDHYLFLISINLQKKKIIVYGYENLVEKNLDCKDDEIFKESRSNSKLYDNKFCLNSLLKSNDYLLNKINMIKKYFEYYLNIKAKKSRKESEENDINVTRFPVSEYKHRNNKVENNSNTDKQASTNSNNSYAKTFSIHYSSTATKSNSYACLKSLGSRSTELSPFDSEASSEDEDEIKLRNWVVKCAYYRYSNGIINEAKNKIAKKINRKISFREDYDPVPTASNKNVMENNTSFHSVSITLELMLSSSSQISSENEDEMKGLACPQKTSHISDKSITNKIFKKEQKLCAGDIIIEIDNSPSPTIDYDYRNTDHISIFPNKLSNTIDKNLKFFYSNRSSNDEEKLLNSKRKNEQKHSSNLQYYLESPSSSKRDNKNYKYYNTNNSKYINRNFTAEKAEAEPNIIYPNTEAKSSLTQAIPRFSSNKDNFQFEGDNNNNITQLKKNKENFFTLNKFKENKIYNHSRRTHYSSNYRNLNKKQVFGKNNFIQNTNKMQGLNACDNLIKPKSLENSEDEESNYKNNQVSDRDINQFSNDKCPLKELALRKVSMIDQLLYICRVIDYISKKQSVQYNAEDNEYLLFYISLSILKNRKLLI